MLWDLIRDFFVQHVFGGYDSEGVAFGGVILTGNNDDISAGTYCLDLGFEVGEVPVKTCYGDWLSTTATAISITIIVVLCCLFVYKIIKLIGGLIR